MSIFHNSRNQPGNESPIPRYLNGMDIGKRDKASGGDTQC